jgi:aryl-alcohol dehydrogenase-like predicted oxidoreductase
MMRYKLLGQSGLRVSELALGTMTFGTDWGWGADKETAHKIMAAYADAGGNFIDTANNYTNGSSEHIVGEFIASERDQYVLATKYTLRLANGNSRNANLGGNSRKSMMRAIENSLRRLNTDYIDLFYLHMWDFMTPVEEVMRGLDDLVRAGKVLYVGLSDTPAWVIAYAIALAERYGWVRPVATQLPYSFANRDAERDILPMSRALGLSVTAWGLLGGGALTGKYNQSGSEPKRYNDASPEAKDAASRLAAMAQEIGRTPAQLAINWARQQANVIPVLGARTEAQIKENLGVLEFNLTAEQLAEIGGLIPFEIGFPVGFLTSAQVRQLAFGDFFELIDHPGSAV